MTKPQEAALSDKIRRVAKERRAVILAHNYQTGPVQDIADFVGDSLGLARQAAKTDAEVILFCGVHFMAETASILSPEKTVLLPDLEAGCSLSDTLDAVRLRRWKERYPDAVVVTYVNTTAEVKALSDYCCTSGNAVKVVESIDADLPVLFGPDMFLGAYVSRVTRRDNLHLWVGACHVHASVRSADAEEARAAHPNVDLLVHPECACVTTCLTWPTKGESPRGSARILSTEGMVHAAREAQNAAFIVATESGIIHRLKKEGPTNTYIPLGGGMECEHMKKITIEKVLRSLEENVHEVSVPPEIREKALVPIERMVSIG